jgi:hypothetical protein
MRSVLALTRRFAAIPLIAAAVSLLAPVAHAADPTTADCLSASNTSIKLRRDHSLREARQQLLVCAAQTCPSDISAECERHLVAVNAAIPTLVFEVKDAAGNDLPAVSVMMDGKPLTDRLEGTAISLDPGAHSFHFAIAGQTPVDKMFVLHEGEKDRRERIVFGIAAPISAPPGSVQATHPGTNANSSVPTGESSVPSSAASGGGMSTLRTLGLVSGGVGLVGLGMGAVFGMLAGSASSSQQNNCASPTNCPNHAQALSDRSTFTTDSSVEIAGFVAGGVLVAAGVAMFIAGGSKEPAKTGLLFLPTISPESAGLTLRGGF